MTEENVGLLEGLEVEEPKSEDAPEPDPRAVREVVREASPTMARPEGLADELWDEEKKDINKSKLLEDYNMRGKRINDMRAIIAKGLPKAPESIEEYQFEFSEDVQKFVPEGDPALEVAKAAALKAKIPTSQLQEFISEYVTGLHEKGLATGAQEQKTQAQVDAENQQWYEQEKAKLGEAGERTKSRLTSLVSDAYKNGSLSKSDLEAFKNAAFNADGILFLEKFAALHSKMPSNGLTIPTEAAVAEGGYTKDQLDAMAGDPRMSDPVFRQKRSDAYRALERQGRLSAY